MAKYSEDSKLVILDKILYIVKNIISCIVNVWHRGESKVTVSPLCSCHKPTVAMVDPGDNCPVGLIRLLTDSNTTAAHWVSRIPRVGHPPTHPTHPAGDTKFRDVM